mmetsp:Transcript_9560/g.24314  ORF Transcript_9560/g.24314 Transcript_9560/m.24314 type:complete len:253 (-) Transcript_9560:152-910(-)
MVRRIYPPTLSCARAVSLARARKLTALPIVLLPLYTCAHFASFTKLATKLTVPMAPCPHPLGTHSIVTRSDMEERNLTDMQDEGWFDDPGPNRIHGMPEGFDPNTDEGKQGSTLRPGSRPLYVEEPHSSEEDEGNEPMTPLSPETPELFSDERTSENGSAYSASNSPGGHDPLVSPDESERGSVSGRDSGSASDSNSDSDSDSDSGSESDLMVVDDERKAKKAAKTAKEEERRRQLRAMYGVSTEDATGKAR